jgi:DNA-binding transcriptional MerR regulator
MNTGEVSEWVGVSRSTIRKYLGDFGGIEGAFSQSALPKAGRHRRFTDRDVAVIAWIAHQYQEYHLNTDEIRITLTERLDGGEEFETPPHPEDETSLAVIPREQHEEILAAHQRALERAVAERDALMTVLDRERRDHTKEISHLNREIGRLAQLVRQLGEDPEID